MKPLNQLKESALDQLTQVEKGLDNRTEHVHRYIHALEDPWIAVDDRLPEEGQLVLIAAYGETNYGKYFNGYFHQMRQDETRWGGIYLSEVTRWMPLPEPPEGQQ